MTDQRLRIGIVGQMMSGKTTLAETMIHRHGFQRLALADPVKDTSVIMVNVALQHISSLTGKDYPQVNRQIIERDKHIFRPLLQWVGTEFGREYVGPDTIWIEELVSRANYIDSPTACDDIRFHNEADGLRERGFTVFRITRDPVERMKALRAKYTDAEIEKIMSHPSEIAVPDLRVDHEFYNIGTDLSIFDTMADQIMGLVNNVTQ